MTRRIAISGGPGGGKSTVCAALRREFGERVLVVPEVATHLLAGFFPGIRDADDRRAVQRAIYHVQLSLEALYRDRAPEATTVIFDRGLVDGAAYWPDGCDAFFATLGTDPREARERYDTVVFLESAARGGLGIGTDNLARTEQRAEAARLDALLHQLWASHPDFRFVPHTPSFETKVENALAVFRALLPA